MYVYAEAVPQPIYQIVDTGIGMQVVRIQQDDTTLLELESGQWYTLAFPKGVSDKGEGRLLAVVCHYDKYTGITFWTDEGVVFGFTELATVYVVVGKDITLTTKTALVRRIC